ncbi:hypothetical protein KP509_1Z148200 [Ceratopteris richardii]|nr:hypothetical protein KP509_1Z148200 [Ceratopteris richardii]
MTIATSISAPIVLLIVLAVVWLLFVCLIFAYLSRTKSTARGFSDPPTSRTPGDNQILHSFHETAVMNQTQNATLSLGAPFLEEKLMRQLPVFYYRRCMFDAMAKGPLSVRLLQSTTGHNKLMRSNSYGGAQKSQDECAVCLNPFQEKERVRILPTCEHLFHVSCIDMWLQSHANCPVCRQNITLPEIHKFLSSLEFHRAEDENTSESPVNNGEFLALSGFDHQARHTTTCEGIPEDVPSPSGQSHNQKMPFRIDASHILHVHSIPQLMFDHSGGSGIGASERHFRCHSMPSLNDPTAFQIRYNAYDARSADGTQESLKFSNPLKDHSTVQRSPCERVHPNCPSARSYRRLCWMKVFPTSLSKSLSTGSFIA